MPAWAPASTLQETTARHHPYGHALASGLRLCAPDRQLPLADSTDLQARGLAYVFIHLLPELASGGRTISDAIGMHRYLPNAMTESLLFLVTLVGVVIP